MDRWNPNAAAVFESRALGLEGELGKLGVVLLVLEHLEVAVLVHVVTTHTRWPSAPAAARSAPRRSRRAVPPREPPWRGGPSRRRRGSRVNCSEASESAASAPRPRRAAASPTHRTCASCRRTATRRTRTGAAARRLRGRCMST